MIVIHTTKDKVAYVNRKPTRKQLERLNIDELVCLARRKRSIKTPLKKILVDYVASLGELE